MENSDYIDRYFNNELNASEKTQFEQKIIDNKDFAEEVAFYYSVWASAKNEVTEEKKKRFGEIYQNTAPNKTGIVKRISIYLSAAAAVVAVVLIVNVSMKPDSSQKLADQYIQEHLKTLGVSMSSRQDSIQVGLDLYNDGKLQQALGQFEAIIARDTVRSEAKKYAGIVSLQLRNYDKALAYFSQLENDISLFSNPAKLYKALTLMERNHAGDAEQAKALLRQVVQNNLDGKETAEEWLSKKW